MGVEISKEVIQMVLDVSGFQDAADEALNVLDEIRESIDFSGLSDSIAELGESTKNLGMDALYDQLFKVQDGFNALDLLALKVLSRIEDKVLDVAESLGKAITIDPIKSGLEEYETQINSVQTILANTGDKLKEDGLTTEHERIEKINGVLDELNHYADMTIYNFTEMTRNIGTFTAAGVELDTAATAIQGIANLAAMSGSNSQQASTAMYQLSQALASGTVKLQDWNSVVNAGMGGKLFQNELIETAKAMHTADETMAELTNGTLTFRDSLQEGWLTSDVLINTLEKFTAGTEGYTHAQVESMKELWRARGYSEEQIKDLTSSLKELSDTEEAELRKKWEDKGFSPEQVDHILEMGAAATDAATKVKTLHQLIDTLKEALQSGWTQSWEYIFGDFEQAKAFWTEISDIMNVYIGKSADARNEVLEAWSKATYSYNEDGKLILAESGEIVEDQRMLSEIMGGRELVIQGLRNAFQGVFEVVLKLGEAWDKSFLGKGGDNDISITAEKLIDLSRQFESFTKQFKESLVDAEGNATPRLQALQAVFNTVFAALRKAFDSATNIFNSVVNIGDAFFHSEFFKIDFLNSLAAAVTCVADGFTLFGNAFNKHFGPENAANREGLMIFFGSLQGVLESAVWTKLTWMESAWLALGSVFDKLVEPFGTFSNLLGVVGNYISIFVKAFDIMTHTADGGSRIAIMFQNIAKSINGFIDTIRKNIDFSAFQDLFASIINTITSDKVDLFGSFENIIMSVVNVFKALFAVVTPVATAFAEVMAPAVEKIGLFIKDVTTRFRDFTESLIANEPVMKGIHDLFTGIFKVISAVGEVLGDVFLGLWDGFASLISSFLPDGKEFGDILTDIGKGLSDFAEIIKSMVSGEDGVPKFSDVIGGITDRLKGFFEVLKSLDLLEKLKGLIDAIFKGIKHALGGTDDMSMLDVIIEKVQSFMTRLKDIFSDDDGNLDFEKVFTTGGIIAIIDRIVGFMQDFSKNTSGFSNIVSILKTFADGIGEALEALKNRMKVDTIKMIADSLLEIAIALFVIAMIDPIALGQAMTAVGAIFTAISQLLEKIAGFKTNDTGQLAAAAGAIAAIGTSMLLLSIALAIMGNMDFDDMLQGLLGVSVLLGELTLVIIAFSKFADADAVAGTGSLIALAIALDLLIIPVKMFGDMNLDQLGKGLVSTSILLGELVASAILLSNFAGKFGVTDGIGLILMAEAIKVLGKTVIMLKDLTWEELGKGLAVFTAGLVGMVGAAAIISVAHLGDDILELGAALMMLGISMGMFAVALHGIAGLTWEDLGKGLAVFAAALLGLGIASYAINGANLLMIGGAIFLIATAFTELSIAINLTQILGPLCQSLAAGLNAIKDSAVQFANNAAFESFLGMLQRFLLFLPELATGLAGAFITFLATIASKGAELVTAFVTLGASILAGLTTLLPQVFEFLGTFFTQIWTFIQTQVPQFFETLNVIFGQLWPFLQEQTPQFFAWLGTVLSGAIQFLAEHSIELVQAISSVLDTILQAIINEAPKIGEAAKSILDTVLNLLMTEIPNITATVLALITALLTQLATFVPIMADMALKIILGFLKAVADNIDDIVQSGIDIALGFIKGVTEKMDDIVDAAFKMLIGFIEGLAKAIDENHQALFDAVGHLITAIFNAIVDGVVTIATGAQKLITGFMDEFDGEQLMQDLANIGSNLVQGVINGIVSFGGFLWDAAGNLATGALNALADTFRVESPSKEGFEIGGYLVQGLTNGVNENSEEFISATGDMAYGALESLDALNQTPEFEPVISPVLDDSNVQNGLDLANADMQAAIHQDINIISNDIISKQQSMIENLANRLTNNTHELYQNLQNHLNSINQGLVAQANAINGMQVVLDSGALVGNISADIDSSLGSAASLYRRGVI